MSSFTWKVDEFADVMILRYRVDSWDKLTLQQKKLAFFLSEAGYSGRDIIYMQHHRCNMDIRLALEAIVCDNSEKSSTEYLALLEYTKRMFMSNGIHHHYGNDKVVPQFSRTFFVERLAAAGGKPLSEEALRVMFDIAFDSRMVDQRAGVDSIASSAVNFYEPGLTTAEGSKKNVFFFLFSLLFQ